jgi:hypothetical protein
MVHQPQSHGQNKGKAKQNQNNNKPNQTTTFKKKKNNNKEDEGYFICGSPDHWAKKCLTRKGRKPQPEQNTANIVVSSSGGGTSVYSNLLYVLSVFQSTTWWFDTGANVHVCLDASLFSSYQVAQDSCMMMGNGPHASVYGIGTVDLKLTSEKIMHLRNVQYVPSINKNLVSDSLLCRDGFKVVLESNKFVVSKCGQFISKGYVCGRLCHLNFCSMFRLSSLNLISNLSIIKGSKCQSCVQSKQPRKPHKTVGERHLALLELIHSNICEMNGVLT